MLGRFATRLVAYIVIVIGVFVVSRAIIRALPGDPLETVLAESGTSLPVAEIRAELGLDAPFGWALVRDASRAFHGDLGVSFITRRSIAPMLGQALKRTLMLSLLSVAFAFIFSVSLGLAAAGLPNERLRSFADRICLGYGACVAALPTPWMGPMLMLIFCVWTPILPTGGNILLPSITLALARFLRRARAEYPN